MIQRIRTAMTPNRGSTVQEPPHHSEASSPAWPAFKSKLAEALAVLEEDQYLVITEKSGWAYVQFAGQGSFGVRAECVSNNYLDEAHALRADQMTALQKIGWLAPTGTPAEASPKRQAVGSPNFFRDFDRPVPYDPVARMAVRALTEVFEIPHPGYLMYKAFDKKQRTILVPTLGLMREAQGNAAAVAEATSPDHTNLALENVKLAGRLREAEGFLERLRPLARKADFYRGLLVERCGEQFVRGEENEEDFRQALELERMKEDGRLWWKKVN
jgi:hypothetical protein